MKLGFPDARKRQKGQTRHTDLTPSNLFFSFVMDYILTSKPFPLNQIKTMVEVILSLYEKSWKEALDELRNNITEENISTIIDRHFKLLKSSNEGNHSEILGLVLKQQLLNLVV